MAFKLCPRSFFMGAALTFLAAVLVCAQAPKAPPPTRAVGPVPVVQSPDYERVSALIARLEAIDVRQAPLLPSVQTSASQFSSGGFVRVTPVPWTPKMSGQVSELPSTAAARVAENGSWYGQSNANGVPKTVHVDGYYRRDGTYVQGHYRSPPGSNPR